MSSSEVNALCFSLVQIQSQCPLLDLKHINTRPRVAHNLLRVAAKVSSKQQHIRAIAPEPRVVQPRRLPIPHPRAQSSRHSLYNIHDVIDPLRLAGGTDGYGGIAEAAAREGFVDEWAGVGPVRLDDVHRFAVLGGEGGEGAGEVGQGGGRAVEGVEAEAEDVPVGGVDEARAGQGAEPGFLQRQVPAVVDVDHDAGRWGDGGVADAGAGGGPEGGQGCEVRDALGVEGIVGGGAAEGPEEPVVDLVAEADEGEGDPGGGEGGKGGADVGAEAAGEGGERGVGPGGGDGLVAGVGPRVGEVEVEVDGVAGGVEAGGEGEIVREAVDAVDGVDPDSGIDQQGN